MSITAFDPFAIELGPTVGVLLREAESLFVGWTGRETRCLRLPGNTDDPIATVAEGLARLQMPADFEVVMACSPPAAAAAWQAYLDQVRARLQPLRMRRLSLLQSCGGRTWSALSAAHPLRARGAQQAAGIVAAAHLGRLAGAEHFVSFESGREQVSLGLGGQTPHLSFQRQTSGLDTGEPAVVCVQVALETPANRVAAELVRLADMFRQPLRDSWLIAFGDDAVERAWVLAETLEIPGVLLPPNPKTFAVCGTLWADVVAYAAWRFDEPIDAASLDLGELRQQFGQLMDQVAESIFREGYDLDNADVVRLIDARCVLTDRPAEQHGVEITFPADWLTDRERLLSSFHAAHEEQTGVRFVDRPVELLGLRVRATIATTKPPLPEAPGEPGVIGELLANWQVEVISRGIRRVRGA